MELNCPTRAIGGPKSLQLCFSCYHGHGVTLPRTVLFLPMVKLPSKIFSSKFGNWLLYLVVSRQNLKSIAGYTLQTLQQDGKRFQPQLDLLQPLYDGFDISLTTSAGASAGRGSHTLLTDTVLGLMKQFMKCAHKKSFAALEEDNLILFKEFFPAGQREFSAASRKGLGTSFDHFVKSLTNHKTDVANAPYSRMPRP